MGSTVMVWFWAAEAETVNVRRITRPSKKLDNFFAIMNSSVFKIISTNLYS